MALKKKIIVPRFKEDQGFTTTEKHSDLMRKIRYKNTKCEVRLSKALWKLGYRYRLNVNYLPGKPDLVFKSIKLAIFIDGDFWHGNQWEARRGKIKANRKYWIPKIERNIQRDLEVNNELTMQGWTILRFWESEVLKNINECVSKTVAEIKRKRNGIYKFA